MIEFTASHFDDLCRAGPVRMQISTIEETRKAAVRSFWTYLLGGIALAAAIVVSLTMSGWDAWGWIGGGIVLIVAIILAILPLSRAGETLKHPTLEKLAEMGGMEYLPSGFDPPVYPEARKTLFGGWLSGETFTDLFHGTDADGKRFALYEGVLTRKSGKSTVTVFSGQMYAFQRRSKSNGTIAVVPDRGLFNFFKPASGMERVKFESDPDFEKKFEVYATHPTEALSLLGSDVRRLLLDLRQTGKVLAYLGPEDVFAAVWGKNLFEAGSMFRAVAGQDRVKKMFDDVCASLTALGRFKRALD
jgi:hypothetical protein